MQPTLEDLVERIVSATSWDERIQEIRRVPEVLGQARHQAAYAAIAAALYRNHLSAQFAYIQWRPEYQLGELRRVYLLAHGQTAGFSNVEPDDLQRVLALSPEALRIFRLIVGYTTGEFAVAASEAASRLGLPPVRKTRVDAMESGTRAPEAAVRACADAIHLLMTGSLWDLSVGDFRSKLDKPDTELGWESVRRFAREGVPYDVLLHQRHYGGPFRTLLDATSSARGDILELPLEELLVRAGVPHVRTSARNQAIIADRFGITIRPAPDFVIFEGTRTLRAMIECKQANDGGTARDKASRFRALAGEAPRLGGIALFAVLDGLGWQRDQMPLGQSFATPMAESSP